MCKKYAVAYADQIGNRLVGFCCWNGRDYSFLSSKNIINHLKQGNLAAGLTLSEEGSLILDTTYSQNLMGKSGLSFSRFMAADDEDEFVMNKYYALVKVVKAKDGNSYHFITNRCGYEMFTEDQVKAMLAIIDMGGIKLGEDGSLVIHESVDVEEANGSQNKNQGVSKGKEVGA